MEKPPLGRYAYFHAFTLRGKLSPTRWCALLKELVCAIGMTPIFEPKVWDYGEIGQIIVQPIIESFVAVDAWPNHNGAYLTVCSCRDFDPDVIPDLLMKWELTVGDGFGEILKMPINEKELANG